jgi:transcriptional regulator with XRE-family HTH domain
MASTAYASEIAHLRSAGHLSDDDIARATGAGRSTVNAWLRGSRRPSGERAERLAELSAIVDRLSLVMAPDYIPLWLRKPQAGLGDDKPIDVMARGEYRKVSSLVAALESPVAS